MSKFSKVAKCQSLNINLETIPTATWVWDSVSEDVRVPVVLQIPAALLSLSAAAI